MDPHALSLIVVTFAAFVLPLVAGRLRLPAVVVEILFGVMVGPAFLGLIHSSGALETLGELGFFLLMFLAGFEIDFRRLRERSARGQVRTGLTCFAITLALSWLAVLALGHGPFFILLLATTSLGLVVPTLRNTRRQATPLGQTIVICALTADFLTLIATTVMALFREHGAGVELLCFPALFAAIAVVLLLLKQVAWWHPKPFERLFAADDPEELGIRATLALMFVFVGLSSLLGVEPILGAFLAGTAFALVFPHRGHLERKLNGFSYGFLIPIFFIHVGVEFELGALFQADVLLDALALIAAALGVKVVATALVLGHRHTARETIAAGVLLSARLSLVIAVAEIGVRLGFLDPVIEAQVILLAAVTATLAPTAFERLLPATTEAVESDGGDRGPRALAEPALEAR